MAVRISWSCSLVGSGLVGTDFVDELSADDTAPAASDNVVSVFILGDIPAAAVDGDAANIRLTATAHKSGTVGTLDAIEAETGVPDDPASVQIVFDVEIDSDDDGGMSVRVGGRTAKVAEAWLKPPQIRY